MNLAAFLGPRLVGRFASALAPLFLAECPGLAQGVLRLPLPPRAHLDLVQSARLPIPAAPSEVHWLCMPPEAPVWTASLRAAPGSAQESVAVRGVRGHAEYLRPGNPWQPLVPGLMLTEGCAIRTAKGMVDVWRDIPRSVLRLQEHAELGFTALRSDRGNSNSEVLNVLTLRRGELLGNLRDHPARPSRYEVRTPLGVAVIRGPGEFRVAASGAVTVVSGGIDLRHGATLTRLLGGQSVSGADPGSGGSALPRLEDNADPNASPTNTLPPKRLFE